MKRIASSLVIAVFVAGAVLAANEPRLSTARGDIASIDQATKSLVVRVVGGEKADGQTVTFVVPDDSKIVRGASAIALADLKAGDKVSVTYQARDGRNVVVNIGVETRM